MLVGYEVIKAKEARTYPTRAHGTIIPQACVRYETIELNNCFLNTSTLNLGIFSFIADA